LTIKQLEEYHASRKELLLVERQMMAMGEESHQTPRLKERLEKLTAELDMVNDYIDSLDDSLSRQLITLRYVEGMTRKDVGAFVGLSEVQAGRRIKSLLSVLPDS